MAYWQKQSEDYFGFAKRSKHIPAILLWQRLPPQTYDDKNYYLPEATTGEDGCLIEFAAEGLEPMPDKFLRVIISHELVHALRYAEGRNKPERRDEERETRFENQLMNFDEEGLYKWLVKNRKKPKPVQEQ